MSQLAQAYIHLRPFEVSRNKLVELGRDADQLAFDIAARVYGADVTLDVTLEEGSLKTRMKVFGAIIVLAVGGVANYKPFKEGAVELYEDAKQFCAEACEAFVDSSEARESQVFRVERRLKASGKLYRLIRRLERLDGAIPKLSRRDVLEELRRARQELDRLEHDLAPNERQVLERMLKYKNVLPVSDWPDEHRKRGMPRVAIRREDEDSQLFPTGGVTSLVHIEPIMPRDRRVRYHNVIDLRSIRRADRGLPSGRLERY